VNAMMLEMVGINGLEWLEFNIFLNVITHCIYLHIYLFLGLVAG